MAKQETTKAQKKLKNAVIKKWIPEKLGRNLKKSFMGATVGISGVIACGEMLLYGFPFISIGLLGVTGLEVSKAVCSYTNKADQKFETSDVSVALALIRMDDRMSKIFNSYAVNENAREKSALESEMESVYEDAKALEGFYEIVEGGSKGYGRQSITFEVVAANEKGNVVTPAVTFNDVANGTVKHPQKSLRDTPSFKI